jgi:hypothetical protein
VNGKGNGYRVSGIADRGSGIGYPSLLTDTRFPTPDTRFFITLEPGSRSPHLLRGDALYVTQTA